MDSIIGFVVFAIMILGFVLSAKNKAKQEHETEKTENFPFPFPFDIDDAQMEYVPPVKVDEIVIAEGRVAAKKPTLQRASQTPMAKYSTKDDMQIIKAERSEIIENFDLKQAVIYSMILKPKFDDNIF